MDSPWKAPGASSEPEPPVQAGPSMDDPVGVLRVSGQLLAANALGYLLAGLAYLLVVLGAVTLGLGGLALGIAPGLALEHDGLLVGGGLIGTAVYVAVILLVSFVAFPLMSASLLRAVDEHRVGGPAPGFTSPFTRMRPNAGRVVAFYCVGQLAVLVGAMLLYLPGLVALAVATFALPIVVFEGVGPVRALQLGFDHLRANPAWHLGVWLLVFAIAVILEITVVGLLLIWPLLVVTQAVAYRQAFSSAGAAAVVAGSPRDAS